MDPDQAAPEALKDRGIADVIMPSGERASASARGKVHGAVDQKGLQQRSGRCEHRLPHGFTRPEPLAVDRFHLQRMEEAFGTGIVITVGAHAAPQLVPGYQRLIGAGAILAARSLLWTMTPHGNLRFHKAICSASQTRSAVMRSDIAQPITLREYRSIMTAR